MRTQQQKLQFFVISEKVKEKTETKKSSQKNERDREIVNGQVEDETMSDLPASWRQIWPRSNQLLSSFVELLSVKCEWRWLRLLAHATAGEQGYTEETLTTREI